MPDFRLDGKVALVTGGNSGIGRAIAIALAEHGARIAIAARNEERNAAVADEIGDAARAYAVDVGDADAVQNAVDAVFDDFGALDVLVNNAGTAHWSPAPEHPLDAWRRVLDVNLTSALVASQRFASRAERGKIINIVSEYATFGGPGLLSYTASKHGLAGLTKTMAIDLAPDFQVNAIQPGWIATPMTEPVKNVPEMNAEVLLRTPMGRWGRPEDHAGAAVFLASSASDFVTGVTIPVDGGYRIR
ncbi:MAG TPA: glucose 1-dehydrogenase [Actinomycetota bacterium]|nr:glucose 1-dehydrogenase [Actinomycetota bacterium]